MSSAILLHKRVLISGLVSRPELNGTIATAMHWYESKGRYGVLFESGDCISLKAGNLTDLAKGYLGDTLSWRQSFRKIKSGKSR